jgi:transglutaminase-like putative cysteine protease
MFKCSSPSASVTRLITPWYKRTPARAGGKPEAEGSIAATPILDHGSPEIRRLVARARSIAPLGDELAVLHAAHAIIRDEVRAVYALTETTPASRTLARGSGSCSQRLAVLESAARSMGVPTRVRARLIDRSFWYPRFPRISALLPDRILLVWPEFRIEGWRNAGELFGPIGCHGGTTFTNDGAETLFEAAGRCAIDWEGNTNGGEFDLSSFVRADFGYFADRDEAFHRLGQALCTPSRVIADPVLRRIAA